MPTIPTAVRRLAATHYLLRAPRGPQGDLLDPEGIQAEVEAILAYEGEEDGQDLQEACIPNKVGKGMHDDKTGHPCSKEGQAKSAQKQSQKKERQRSGKATAGDKATAALSAIGDVTGALTGVAKATAAAVSEKVSSWAENTLRASPQAVQGLAKAAGWVGAVLGLGVKRGIVKPLKAVEHGLQAAQTFIQQTATETVTERGYTPEQAEKVAWWSRALDGFNAWTANVPVAHEALHTFAHIGGLAGFGLSKLAFFVPVGSLAYLAYATTASTLAGNPFATLRAARNVIKNGLKHGTDKHLHEAEESVSSPPSREAVEQMADHLAGPDHDWYSALLACALDETHDSAEAVGLANRLADTGEDTLQECVSHASLPVIQDGSVFGERQPLQEAEDETPDLDDAEALAAFYAEIFNALEVSGDDIEDLAEQADEELNGSGWNVARKPSGAWAPVRDTAELTEAFLLEGGERAPKGGISIGGVFFTGGRFIPKEAIKNASPEDRIRLEQAQQIAAGKAAEKQQARTARGGVDVGDLSGRLQRYARSQPLTPSEKTSAGRAARALFAHHGDLTAHRIEELAKRVETALKATDRPGVAKYMAKQLSKLHHALQFANERGVSGDAPGSAPQIHPPTPARADAHGVAFSDLKNIHKYAKSAGLTLSYADEKAILGDARGRAQREKVGLGASHIANAYDTWQRKKREEQAASPGRVPAPVEPVEPPAPTPAPTTESPTTSPAPSPAEAKAGTAKGVPAPEAEAAAKLAVPMKLYHGTRGKYEGKPRPGWAQGWGVGVYLASDPTEPTSEFGFEGRVLEYYADLKKPLRTPSAEYDAILSDLNEANEAHRQELLARAEEGDDAAWDEAEALPVFDATEATWTTKINNEIRRRGYDGVIAKHDAYGDEVVVFDPANLLTAEELVQKHGKPAPSPDDPGFTGTDAQGREWRDGELVAKVAPEPAPAPAAPAAKAPHEMTAAEWQYHPTPAKALRNAAAEAMVGLRDQRSQGIRVHVRPERYDPEGTVVVSSDFGGKGNTRSQVAGGKRLFDGLTDAFRAAHAGVVVKDTQTDHTGGALHVDRKVAEWVGLKSGHDTMYGTENNLLSLASQPDLEHRTAVQAALAAGKPVPPEVLADYPDLAPSASPPPAEAAPAPAGGGKGKTMPAVTPKIDPDQLQDIADSTRTGAFGDNKVFISHAYEEAKKRHPGLTLDAFKEQLLDAHRAGKIQLTRADLVQAMDPADVEASQIAYGNATWNFITVKPDNSREWTKAEQLTPGKADDLSSRAGRVRAGSASPYEYTQAEWRKRQDYDRASRQGKADIDAEHRKKVVEALAGEMDIHPEVLADYPDLAPKSSTPPAAPAPAAGRATPHSAIEYLANLEATSLDPAHGKTVAERLAHYTDQVEQAVAGMSPEEWRQVAKGFGILTAKSRRDFVQKAAERLGGRLGQFSRAMAGSADAHGPGYEKARAEAMARNVASLQDDHREMLKRAGLPLTPAPDEDFGTGDRGRNAPPPPAEAAPASAAAPSGGGGDGPAARFGRKPVEGAEPQTFQVFGLAKGDHGTPDGHVHFDPKTGKRYLQVSRSPRRYLSRDRLDDEDLFGEEPGGAHSWEGVEVEPTDEERRQDQERAEAAARARSDREQAASQAKEAKEAKKVAWESRRTGLEKTTASKPSGAVDTGNRLEIGDGHHAYEIRLPDGRIGWREELTGGDDYRTHYWLPGDSAREARLASARASGITPEFAREYLDRYGPNTAGADIWQAVLSASPDEHEGLWQAARQKQEAETARKREMSVRGARATLDHSPSYWKLKYPADIVSRMAVVEPESLIPQLVAFYDARANGTPPPYIAAKVAVRLPATAFNKNGSLKDSWARKVPAKVALGSSGIEATVEVVRE